MHAKPQDGHNQLRSSAATTIISQLISLYSAAVTQRYNTKPILTPACTCIRVNIMWRAADLRAFVTKQPDGIYQLPSGTGRGQGHAVTLIGYNNGGGGYWIVKNSFGLAWGNGGFFKASTADMLAAMLSTCNCEFVFMNVPEPADM